MRVAVVGAGVSGLACAYRLQNAGHAVTVFEASGLDGPDGEDRPVRWGGPRVQSLLDRLDAGRAPERGGAPFPECRVGLIGCGLGLRANLRRLLFLGDAARRGSQLDLFDLGAGDDALDGVDAWSATAARFGGDVADGALEPLVRTLHGHSARRVSLKYASALVHALIRRPPRTRTSAALPRALRSQLPVRARPAVLRVAPSPRGPTLTFADREADFQAVVLATSAPAALRLLADPTAEQRRFLEGVRHAAGLRCSYRVAPAPPRVARTVPFERSTLIASYRQDDVASGEAGLSVRLHDEAASALLALDDATVLGVVARELDRVAPDANRRLLGRSVWRQAAAAPIPGVGDSARARAFWSTGQGAGRIWLCGEHLGHPWLEGAVRCAERVADEITEGL